MIDRSDGSRKLTPMRPLLLVAFLALALPACERAERPVDTTAAPPPGDSTLPADTAGAAAIIPEWVRSLGPYLLVVGESPGEAVVLRITQDETDTLPIGPVRGDRISIVDPAGVARPARVSAAPPPADSGRCASWPVVRIAGTGREVTSWTIGFPPDRAMPLHVDSLSSLAGRDSASLAAAIARAASIVPGDSARGFRGLPFVVRAAWRTAIDGRRIIVADVERRINQEADPRVERLALIAEEAAPGGQLEPVWSERITGREDAVPTTDLLAVLRLPVGITTAALARIDDTGSLYLLLERTAAGGWAVRWSSADAGC